MAEGAEQDVSQLSNIEAELKKQGSRVRQLKKEHNNLHKLFDDYRENIMDQINNGELGCRVTAIETDVAKMRKLYSSFNATLDEINAQKSLIESKLDSFKQLEKLREDMAEVISRCDGHDQRLDKHGKFLRKQEEGLGKNTQSLSDANHEIEELKEELERVKEKHARDIKALREEMAALVAQTKAETLEQLQPTVDTANECQERFDAFEKKVKSHVAKSMKKQKDANQGVLDQAAADMKAFEDTINSKVGDLDGRVTGLEAKVKEDIVPGIATLTANLKATDAAIQSTNNKIENDIRTLIATNAERIANNMDFCNGKFDDIEARFNGLDEFNGNTTARLRELNETVETKEEEMTKFVKGQVREVTDNFEEYKKNVNTRATAIEQSVSDLDKKTADDYAELTKRTEKHFANVNKAQDKSVSAHDELKGTVDEQIQKMEDLAESFQTFQAELTQQQTEFHAQIRQVTEEIALAADAAKRTMTSRCDDLENDISLAKKNLGETKADLANKFSEVKADAQRAQDAIQSDMDDFKTEVRRLNSEIRQQNEASKQDILDENASQFTEFKDKMKSLSQIVKEFVGPDGISIQSVSETLTKMRSEIDELETTVRVELDNVNGNIKSHVAKQSKELSEFQETTTASLNSYKRETTAKVEDEIHALKMRLAALTQDEYSDDEEGSDAEETIHGRTLKTREEPAEKAIARSTSERDESRASGKEEEEAAEGSAEGSGTRHKSPDSTAKLDHAQPLLHRKKYKRMNDRLEERIQEIAQQVAELQAAVKERVEDVGSNLGKLTVEIESLKTEMKDTSDSVEVNRQSTLEQVKTLKTALEQSADEVRKVIDGAKAQTEDQLTNVQERLQAVNEALTQARIGGEKTNDEVADLKAEVARLTGSVAKKFENSDERTARIVDDRIKILQEKVDATQELYDSLKGDAKVDLPTLVTNLSVVTDQMKTTNHGFVKSLNDLREEFSQKVADVTGLVNESDERLKAEVEDLRKASTDNLAEKITSLREKLVVETTALNAKIENLAEKHDGHVGGTTTTIPDILALIESLRQTLDEQIKQVSAETVRRDNDLNSSIDKLADRIQTTSTNVSTVTETVNLKVNQQLVEVRDEINVSQTQITERMRALEDSIQSFSAAFGDGGVESYAKTLKKLKESTAEAFQRVQTTLEDLAKRHQHETHKLQKQVVAIAGGGEMNIKEISDVLEKHQEEIGNLTKDQANFTDELNESFKKFAQKAQSKMRQMADVIGNIDSKFVAEFEKVNTTVTTFQMETAHSFEEVHEEMAKMKQDLLAKGKKRKVSVMTKLGERIDSNDAAIKGHKEAIGAIKEELARLTAQTEDNNKSTHDEIKESLQKLEDKTNQLVTLSTSHADNAIAQLTAVVNENQNQQRKQLKKIKGDLGDDISKLKIELEALRGPNKVSLSAVASGLDSLQQTSSDRFAQIEAKAKEMDARFSLSIETLDTRAGDMASDVKVRFEHVTNTVDSLREEVMGQIAQDKEENEETIAALKNKTGKAVKRLGEIVSSLKDELMVVIDGNKTATDSQLVSIRDDLKQTNDLIVKNQAKMKNDLQDVSDRCTNLTQTEMRSVRKSIEDTRNELYGMIHEAADSTKGKHQRLRGELDELRTVTTERDNELQAALEQVETNLKAMITTSVNQLEAEDTELGHKIAVIQEESRATKQFTEEFGTKQSQDFAALKSEVTKTKSSFQIMVDELASSVKTHMEKRKTEIRAVDTGLREEIKQIKFNLNDLSETTTGSIDDLRKSLTKETNKMHDEVTEAMSRNTLASESLKAAISEISLNLSGPLTNRMESLEAKQDAQKMQLDASDNALRESQEKIIERQQSLEESIGGFKSSIDQVQQLVTMKMSSEVERLEDKQKQMQRSIKGIVSDADDLRQTLGDAQKDITDLQKIKLYNREMEMFGMKFEETIAYINRFRDTICNVIHSSFQGRTLHNGDERFAAATVTNHAKDPPVPKQSSLVIEDLTNDDEIGAKIRAALVLHNDITVTIPEDTRVLWNKTCQLRPHQTLKVIGSGKSSIIQMRGMESFGGLSDPSRLVLDGYGVFELRDLRVEAWCGSAQETQEDLNALIVLRGWDAMGPATVNIENVAIDSDHNVVNVGGNSCAQIQFADCRMSNSKGSATISPVVAKSGAYPSGTGNIIARNVRVAGNKIKWDTSQSLVRSGGDRE